MTDEKTPKHLSRIEIYFDDGSMVEVDAADMIRWQKIKDIMGVRPF